MHMRFEHVASKNTADGPSRGPRTCNSEVGRRRTSPGNMAHVAGNRVNDPYVSHVVTNQRVSRHSMARRTLESRLDMTE